MIRQGLTACLVLEILLRFTFILLNLAHLNIQEPDQTKRVYLVLKNMREMMGYCWKQGCIFIKLKDDHCNLSGQHINMEIQINLRMSRKA